MSLGSLGSRASQRWEKTGMVTQHGEGPWHQERPRALAVEGNRITMLEKWRKKPDTQEMMPFVISSCVNKGTRAAGRAPTYSSR